MKKQGFIFCFLLFFVFFVCFFVIFYFLFLFLFFKICFIYLFFLKKRQIIRCVIAGTGKSKKRKQELFFIRETVAKTCQHGYDETGKPCATLPHNCHTHHVRTVLQHNQECYQHKSGTGKGQTSGATLASASRHLDRDILALLSVQRHIG